MSEQVQAAYPGEIALVQALAHAKARADAAEARRDLAERERANAEVNRAAAREHCDAMLLAADVREAELRAEVERLTRQNRTYEEMQAKYREEVERLTREAAESIKVGRHTSQCLYETEQDLDAAEKREAEARRLLERGAEALSDLLVFIRNIGEECDDPRTGHRCTRTKAADTHAALCAWLEANK